MADPENLVVIVTGGARGLGRAMTLALLRSGARVAVADLPVSAPEVAELKEIAAKEGVQDRLLSIECDVTQWQSCADTVDKVIAHFGAVHGLVNNAAMGMQFVGDNVLTGKRKPFYEVDADLYKKSIETNVSGPFVMAKAVAPHLVKQGFGRIVNITTSHFTMVAGRLLPLRSVQGGDGSRHRDLVEGPRRHRRHRQCAAAGRRRQHPDDPAGRRGRPVTLVQPEVMMAPIVWLMSPRSNGVTGRRIIAKEWDAARLASTPADQVGARRGGERNHRPILPLILSHLWRTMAKTANWRRAGSPIGRKGPRKANPTAPGSHTTTNGLLAALGTTPHDTERSVSTLAGLRCGPQ